jgi:hypothetical protein
MIITAYMLKKAGACSKSVKVFRQEWPKGVVVSKETLLRAMELGMDVRWAKQFAPLLDREAFEVAYNQAFKAYENDLQPAYDIYNNVRTHIEEVFRASTIAANQAREAAILNAKAVCTGQKKAAKTQYEVFRETAYILDRNPSFDSREDYMFALGLAVARRRAVNTEAEKIRRAAVRTAEKVCCKMLKDAEDLNEVSLATAAISFYDAAEGPNRNYRIAIADAFMEAIRMKATDLWKRAQ